MPGGELFRQKSIANSNFRNLLLGMSYELMRANGALIEYSSEILPDKTTKFIDEWESAVGIPDSCFDGSGDVEARRRAVLVKLFALGVQTSTDFITLAGLFGVTVVIYPGKDVFDAPALVPGVTFTTATEARFTIVVTFLLEAAQVFPYTYPIPFGSSEIAILECLFNKVRPANCQVIFQKV